MKTIVLRDRTLARVLLLLLTAASLRAVNANPPAPVNLSASRDTITVQKQAISKKYRIRLYPNANHRVLFFSASGQAGKVFQLFVFDLQGKLIKQANIANRQTTVLNEIEKGNYLFEVFSDDERIEHGQLIVR